MPQNTIGVAGMELYNHNPKRQNISFGNEGTSMIYVSNTRLAGLTAVNAMYRLAPGDTMDFSLIVDGKEIRQPWSAISDAAGGILRHADMTERD